MGKVGTDEPGSILSKLGFIGHYDMILQIIANPANLTDPHAVLNDIANRWQQGLKAILTHC